jgi:flagellar FliL protein
MAEKEDAAEGAEEGAAPPPKKSKLKLIIIAGAAVAVLGGAAGGYFMFFGKKHDGEQHAKAELPKPPVFMEVPEVLVNLTQAPGERTQYIKARVVLEVKEQPAVEQIKPLLPRVTDTFQTYMRELRPADLAGSAGLYRLREELTKRVNSAIAPHQVNAVLFREIVVQ